MTPELTGCDAPQRYLYRLLRMSDSKRETFPIVQVRRELDDHMLTDPSDHASRFQIRVSYHRRSRSPRASLRPLTVAQCSPRHCASFSVSIRRQFNLPCSHFQSFLPNQSMKIRPADPFLLSWRSGVLFPLHPCPCPGCIFLTALHTSFAP